MVAQPDHTRHLFCVGVAGAPRRPCYTNTKTSAAAYADARAGALKFMSKTSSYNLIYLSNVHNIEIIIDDGPGMEQDILFIVKIFS
ncbi:hypothetical protein KDH_54770 [Dictyobacter sp. S3.2.2.5]|uniref:Uncharacterized protein n=1 Tax=Dictyobacter halimunensis TaxID=3026934 RepID=A0ABQ6FWL3_9CHLR|nr:hypothetical protein KDH_54770 [Dictyobacter sp. S3.2.2.5]